MKHIKLITFDVFGTLVDWRSYVEAAFPGCYADFLQASAVRQLPQAAVLPYRRLLAEVGHDLSARLASAEPEKQHGLSYINEQQNFFADGFGCATPFQDARALQQLASLSLLGCLSNSDHRHILDVQKNLGCLFDLTILAEDLGHYKPHTEAWEQIEFQVTRKLGYDKDSWLHVSAYVDFDLEPAKSRGIHTCFIRRRGGSNPADAERLPADFIVEDLWQLVDLVVDINGAPVRYKVRASCMDAATARAYSAWIVREQAPFLLQMRGCQRFQVIQESETEISCEYVFTGQAALAAYRAGPQQEQRRQELERFVGAIHFTQDEQRLLHGCAQRDRYDFPDAPLQS